jgi:predicted nucleic acid-binding protein
MPGLTYDTGALIAAERDDRLMWSLHRAALVRGTPPTVPSAVIAEAWRGGPQHRLSQLLNGCRVEPLGDEQARAVGTLAARSGHADIVDVAVAEGALRRGDAVVTSNRTHIEQIADAAQRRLSVHDV